MSVTVAQLYGDLWASDEDEELRATLGRSLAPRGPELLYDHFRALDPGPDNLVLDVGARDAVYAVEIVRRFGCRAIAVDPVPLHADLARATIAAAGLTERVTFLQSGIEALPIAGRTVDQIWCRDMLNHVDLPRGLAECRRVLKAGGGMLVYQTFATDALEPREAAMLYQAMAIIGQNMDPAYFETTARAAGFAIELRDVVDSEWREQAAEEGSRTPGDDLLAIARLRRNRAALVTRYGEARCEAAHAGILWGIYQFLGKLRPTIYLLRVVG